MFETDRNKTTILIADDHQEILDFIADDLADDYAVIKASDGRKALSLLQNSAVDLVVSDIMMPEMNGYELCKILKEDFQYSHIPFVMLTAKNSLQAKIEGLEYGADAYIEKPFSPAFLQAQIASLLRNREHVRKHYTSSPTLPLESIAPNKADQKFLEKLQVLILENIQDSDLCVDMLADRLCMSRPTLYRKIKALSDLTPNELINVSRLKRAAELLKEGEFKIYEISLMVGFSSSSHFTRSFQRQFGMSPKQYIG